MFEINIFKILHNDLSMKHLSAWWIPILLIPEQKLHRKEISQKKLAELERGKNSFSQIITGNLSALTGQQSMQ